MCTIFPEYYLLCVNNFDKVAKTHLDEWIRFLKTGEIEDSDTAPGLADAKECLDVRKLSREEYLVYRHHKENEAYQRSVISTGYDDGMQDGIKKGRAEGDADRALADAKLRLLARASGKGHAAVIGYHFIIGWQSVIFNGLS